MTSFKNLSGLIQLQTSSLLKVLRAKLLQRIKTKSSYCDTGVKGVEHDWPFTSTTVVTLKIFVVFSFVPKGLVNVTL